MAAKSLSGWGLDPMGLAESFPRWTFREFIPVAGGPFDMIHTFQIGPGFNLLMERLLIRVDSALVGGPVMPRLRLFQAQMIPFANSAPVLNLAAPAFGGKFPYGIPLNWMALENERWEIHLDNWGTFGVNAADKISVALVGRALRK